MIANSNVSEIKYIIFEVYHECFKKQNDKYIYKISHAICLYLILFSYPPIQIEVLALHILFVCFLASSLFKFVINLLSSLIFKCLLDKSIWKSKTTL